MPFHSEWNVKHMHFLQWYLFRLQVNFCKLWDTRWCDRSHRHSLFLLPVWLCGWGSIRMHSKWKGIRLFWFDLSCEAGWKLQVYVNVLCVYVCVLVKTCMYILIYTPPTHGFLTNQKLKSVVAKKKCVKYKSEHPEYCFVFINSHFAENTFRIP